MKSEKKVILVGIIFLLVVFFVGCSREGASENEVNAEVIVWQLEEDVEKYEPYFNEVLQEKGYPYQIDFVMEETKKKGQVVDLIGVGTTSWEKTYGITKESLEKQVIPLDDYFATEHGKQLKATLPERVWDAYRVDGKQYSILSTGGEFYRTAYIWDTELAEKYDVHPENWSENIWEYKDELLKIKNGESRADFLVSSGLLWTYLNDVPGMTRVLGLLYPIVIDENAEEVKAEFLYETDKYREALRGIRELYECGVYQPELEQQGITNAFLQLSTTFTNKEAYLQWQSEDFWENHEMKVIDEDTVWRFGCTAIETGITVESEKPDEVFRFMCALHTDPDLTNAIMWGEKDVTYEVWNNVAVRRGTNGEYLACNRIGNLLIGYAERGDDPNFQETYPQLIENAQISKISGFNFTGKNCEKELQKILQVFRELEYVDGEVYLKQSQLIIDKYKDAGIDKVIEEWNREFQEWKSTQ